MKDELVIRTVQVTVLGYFNLKILNYVFVYLDY